jgi:hypothetical protein
MRTNTTRNTAAGHFRAWHPGVLPIGLDSASRSGLPFTFAPQCCHGWPRHAHAGPRGFIVIHTPSGPRGGSVAPAMPSIAILSVWYGGTRRPDPVTVMYMRTGFSYLWRRRGQRHAWSNPVWKSTHCSALPMASHQPVQFRPATLTAPACRWGERRWVYLSPRRPFDSTVMGGNDA